MKVSSKVYKGIEYIQISELPKEQQQRISDTLNEEAVIKILIDKKVVSNCVQYKDYSEWFDTVYKAPAVVHVVEHRLEPASINIAFGKV